ncbi:RNA polymerase sigma factor [Actinocorallia longicatena]|uniref:RNA polymerase sigma factor n=1 Tax=Actinocorallia longicatena TaxID=111803 RepID=A0ABP6QAK4_9ACTN
MRVDDSDLIGESLRRPEAFAELFDRYAGLLYRYTSRRLGGENAEDVVGETFLVAFARRRTYDRSYRDARPWLFGILTKLISRHHRQEAARYRALERSGPGVPYEESPDERVAAGVAAEGVRAELASALAGLNPGDRDVLLLIAWGDFSYEETAQALAIPVGTVRSRLNRARRKVRASLGDVNPLDEV